MDKTKEKFNQRKEIINYLKALPAEKRCSSQEIADRLLHKFPEFYQEKKSRSKKIYTDAQFRNQVSAEIGAFLYSSRLEQIKRTSEKPVRFYWQDIPDTAEISVSIEETAAHKPVKDKTERKHSEQGLYPLLSKYLYETLKQYPKRINDRKSANRRGPNGNRWLHPDMVSMEFLGENWHDEVNACVDVYTRRYTKLWSFEVKTSLNSSSVRESFFQTVSNSSWANFGYLVAAEIQPEVIGELRMLYAAHGIGVIQLNTNNVEKSKILISARERNEIDWSMVNRLVEENDDFLDYIKLVRHFYQTQRNIRPQDWDIPEVLSKQVNP